MYNVTNEHKTDLSALKLTIRYNLSFTIIACNIMLNLLLKGNKENPVINCIELYMETKCRTRTDTVRLGVYRTETRKHTL